MGLALGVELERRAGIEFYEERLLQLGGSGESITHPLLGIEVGFLWRFAEVWRAGFTVQGSIAGRSSVGLIAGVVPRGFTEVGPLFEARLAFVATGLNCAYRDGCPPTFGAMMVDARGGLLELKPGWRLTLGDQPVGLSLGPKVEAAWLNTAYSAANGAYLGGLLGVWIGVDL